jgi:hypothetical protein
MPMRSLTTFALCLATIVASALGLNKGMVLCIDHHGHLALEHAHVRHAHCHNEGADHEFSDPGPDADHAELHESRALCTDAGQGHGALTASEQPLRRIKLPAAPLLYTPYLSHQPSTFAAGIAPSRAPVAPARAELASLRSVVLTV